MAQAMSARECRELAVMLVPYVDGEYEAADKAEIETHLAGCAACAAVVASERGLRAQLRAAASVRAPAALRGRIEQAVKRERRWGLFRAAVRPEIVAAVAACAGVAAWFSTRYLLAPILDDTVAHHSRNLPVEVSGDAQRVQRWFLGKVDFNVRLPHLENVSISGARLSHVRDHNAAYVVYDGPRAHRVSLFVYDDPEAALKMLGGRRAHIADRDVVLANQRGYNVAMWHDQELVYSLVSDLEERDMVALLQGQNGPLLTEGSLEQVSAPVPSP